MMERYVGYANIPYYSQKREFLLKEGSLNSSQINKWENSLCGLMCACMVLNQFRTKSITVAELLNRSDSAGAFNERRGWVHKGLVSLMGEYGIEGLSKKVSDLSELYSLMDKGDLIMASVSPNYLRPELKEDQNERNGHLIVIVGMTLNESGNYGLFVNDPSSEAADGGQRLLVDGTIFKQSFSGNVIVFNNPKSKQDEKLNNIN